jgi:hypothetical protein
MKVLVKSLITRKFLTQDATWTNDSNQACDFKTSSNAVLFCSIHSVEDSELVLDYPEPGVRLYQEHAHPNLPLDD